LIFYFEANEGFGIDPLADHYAKLFPAWQSRVRTIAAKGEQLPFEDCSFDIVLCDNVVDHAEVPRWIIEEIARVLAFGGLLYFEVNVHHPFYHFASSLHAGWRALGVTFEITPFADHTVHLTIKAARRLFSGLPLHIVSESEDILEVKRQFPLALIRHPGDRLKRLFFKNARYEVVAVKETPPEQ
jgi:SAM-dependent methyltransferase